MTGNILEIPSSEKNRHLTEKSASIYGWQLCLTYLLADLCFQRKGN